MYSSNVSKTVVFLVGCRPTRKARPRVDRQWSDSWARHTPPVTITRLERRLLNIDRFCRENSIRHLKAFGSILGDRIGDVHDDSDLDLLVEFEPGARMTLL